MAFGLDAGQFVERLIQALSPIEDFDVSENGGHDLQGAAASGGQCWIANTRLDNPPQLMRVRVIGGMHGCILRWTWNDRGAQLGVGGEHALDGMESARNNSPKDTQYLRKNSTANQPYFILNSTNGDTIGSSQMYSSGSAMENGIASVKENGGTKTARDNA